MSHPVEPDAENTYDVFIALLSTLPIPKQKEWEERYRRALDVERSRRDYDRRYEESLWGVGHDQSGYPFAKKYGQ